MTATIMTLGDLGLYWLCIGGGLIVGGVTAWIVATLRERRRIARRLVFGAAPVARTMSIGYVYENGGKHEIERGDSVYIKRLRADHAAELEPDTWPAVRNRVLDTRERWERLGKAAAARKDRKR